jgi:hypothetical protein
MTATCSGYVQCGAEMLDDTLKEITNDIKDAVY